MKKEKGDFEVVWTMKCVAVFDADWLLDGHIPEDLDAELKELEKESNEDFRDWVSSKFEDGYQKIDGLRDYSIKANVKVKLVE